MPLVHVDHARVDAHRAQRAHAAGAEQHVLGQARARVGVVETGGDPALEGPVLGHVGVEQEQRDASDVDTPDARPHLGAVDRHADGQGLAVAVAVAHERGGKPVGVGVDPVFVLPPAGVDALAKVALAVHEPDGDERSRAVRGLLEQVAGAAPRPRE